MNDNKRIVDELREAAENTTGAESFVLLIGYEDGHAFSNIIGEGGNVLSLIIRGLNHALESCPDFLETKLRNDIAKIILTGDAEEDAL